MPPFHFNASGPGGHSSTALILVVDDNHDAADMLALVLRRWGYRVVVAYNGADALRLVAAEWPALAILDLNMPTMSGLELARRLRQRSKGRRLPLYALSVDDLAMNDAQREFDLCFVKPANQELLRQSLEQDCSQSIATSGLN